jgi:DNA-binding SARP family transcriptional activator
MATLEITLFGVLSLERGGRTAPPFPSRKARDLLAYLLLDHRALRPREQLADLFWPDLDGAKARHCLNTTLWRLRGVLGPLEEGAQPYLRVDAERIGFNSASDFRLNVAEFEVACRNAEHAGPPSPDRRTRWDRAAVERYRADLLTDCYDEWCLVERERLQLLFLARAGAPPGIPPSAARLRRGHRLRPAHPGLRPDARAGPSPAHPTLPGGRQSGGGAPAVRTV